MLDNDFNISLGGQVDADSVNLSIKNIESKINPIKIKIDTDYLKQQLANIKLDIGTNIGASTSSKTKGKTESASLSLSDIGVDESMLDKTKAKFNNLNKEISETSTYIKDATTQVKVFGTVGADGTVKYKNYVQTTNTGLKEQLQLQKKNAQTVHDLEAAIKSYANQGKLSTKETNKFQEKLGLIKSQTDEIKKSDALKELNTDIKAAANSTGLLGQSFTKAMVKYTTWLGIATIVAQISRAIKSLINEVVELDKTLTSLQMVTGYTDAEMEDLKDTLIDMAKEMGVTVSALASGADEWMRAGLSAADTMDALRASTVMATVANMDNATATQYLIAQMNAYGLAAEELMDIVDKMSAIDIVAATSTEELGEALSLSANSAQLAGIEYDKYLAMIATVSETTRQSASTIGNSFRSIFSRLQKVSIGALVDEEGQSISDVDSMLQGYGINLREVTNDLSDMGALLDLLGSKWDSYTTAQQSEIATTIAGTYQRERFIALMEEWDRVLELEQVSLESSGSAMEKYTIYQDSFEASLNSLNAAWTELATNTIKSSWVEFFINLARGILDVTNSIGGLLPALGLLSGALLTLRGIIKGFQTMTIVGLITTVATGIWAIVNAINNAAEEARQRALEIAQANVDTAQKQRDELEELRQEYISLASTMNSTDSSNSRLEEIKERLIEVYGEEAKALDLVNGKYEDQMDIIDELTDKTLEDLERALNQQYNALMQQYEASKTIDSLERAAQGYGIAGGKKESRQLAQQILNDLEKAADPSERLAKLEEWYNKLSEDDELTKEEKKILDMLGIEIEELRPLVEQIEETGEQLGSIAAEQDYLQSPIRDMVVQFEKDLASLEGMTEEQQRQMVSAIEAQLETIRDSELYETYKQFFEDILKDGDEWIENIKTQDYLLTELDKKLSALQKQKELDEEELEIQEKLLKVEKAREELAKAKQQRIRVFRSGKGFVYEEDIEAVQEANEALQEAIQNATQTDLDKAIAGVEELQAMYNQAQLDQSAAGKTDLRDYFVDPDNVAQWLQMSFEQKKAFLDSFITTRDWNAPATPESILNWVPTNGGGSKNFKGGLSWVGEHGPELVNLPKGSEILSTQRSLRLTSLLNNPSKYLSGNNGNTVLQFNGALNFPNVRNESDASGFIKGLLQIGKNSIPSLT